MAWYIHPSKQLRDDELPPELVVTNRDGSIEQAYLPATTATRRIRSRDGIGRCTCSECGGSVGTCDRYCRHCRAEFVGSEYEGMKQS